MRLYLACEKKARKCATWPNCDCDYYDKVQHEGVRRWVWLPETAHNKAAAVLLAQKKRLDHHLIEEGLKKPAPKPAPRLGAYIAAHLKDVRHKDTRKTTKNLEDFRDFIGADVPLNEIGGARISAWRQALLTRRSKKTGATWNLNTAQRVYNSVKGLFSRAAADDELPDFVNPCDKLADWSQDFAERRLWQPDEQWLIKELPPQFALPLEVGLKCSCRRAEVLALTRHDLSPKGFAFKGPGPKRGWIAFHRKKKKVGMVKVRVPIERGIVDKLRKQLQSPFQQHIFGDPPPEPNAWSSLLTRELRYLGERYGLDTRGLSMHGTRHTATTTMQDDGVSATTAKNMGGWTSTRMVETYSRPAEASMLAAAAGLARRFKPKKPRGLKAVKPAKVRRAPRRATLRLLTGSGRSGA